MSLVDRVGVSFPFAGVSLIDNLAMVDQLVAVGVREFWTGEVNGYDGVAPLALLAGAHRDLTLSCAVLNPYTRGPALLAMTAATLSDLAPGRARFGLGASSPVIVQDWNGLVLDAPHGRIRALIAFLREVLATGRGVQSGSSVNSRGFALGAVPAEPCEIVLGALGPRMLRLAARAADGVVLNFVSPEDVSKLKAATQAPDRELATALAVHTRIFAVPGETVASDQAARRHLAGYLTAPGYRSFQDRLGRRDELRQLHDAWESGDRAAATKAIPDDVVADLVVVGDPSACAAVTRRHLDAGSDTVTIQLLPPLKMEFSAEEQVAFLAATFAELGSV